MVGIRTSQAWMAVYLSDVYSSAYGRDLNAAVVAGGVFATALYSLCGRGLCLPIAGRLSDALVARGVSRTSIVIAWLVLAVVIFQMLSMQVTALWLLAPMAVLLGTSVNCFTLVTASVSETYGSERTASVTGFINMVGQLVGATALAVSGYLGMAMGAGNDNSLAEYQGVWLAGMIPVALAAAIGAAIHFTMRSRAAAVAMAAEAR
jgi:MFS family permease